MHTARPAGYAGADVSRCFPMFPDVSRCGVAMHVVFAINLGLAAVGVIVSIVAAEKADSMLVLAAGLGACWSNALFSVLGLAVCDTAQATHRTGELMRRILELLQEESGAEQRKEERRRFEVHAAVAQMAMAKVKRGELLTPEDEDALRAVRASKLENRL